jgi:hypothetical protein|tara:strand:- start:205 stop:483 length:279 start_codon:yes stop_codon:yes gene_type:complete
MSSFDDYLKQSEVESAIANLVSEIYPILEEVTEELTPWEVTTALTILVSNIAVQNDMDKRVLVNFLAFLLDTTEAYTTQFGEIIPLPSIKRH